MKEWAPLTAARGHCGDFMNSQIRLRSIKTEQETTNAKKAKPIRA